MRKRRKIKETLWREYLQTLNNRESYISITIGFLFVLFVGIFVYNYLNKTQSSKVSKQETGQVVSERKSVAGQKTYTVAKGDDLWKIAAKVSGDGFAWIKIAKANNLSNPSTIHEGNILIIPE